MSENQSEQGAETLPVKPYYPKEGDTVTVDQPALNVFFEKKFPGHSPAVFPNPTEILSDAFYNNTFLCYAARVRHAGGWQIIPVKFIALATKPAPEPLAIGDSVVFIRDITDADLQLNDNPNKKRVVIKSGQTARVIETDSHLIPGLRYGIKTGGENDSDDYWYVKPEWLAKL